MTLAPEARQNAVHGKHVLPPLRGSGYDYASSQGLAPLAMHLPPLRGSRPSRYSPSVIGRISTERHALILRERPRRFRRGRLHRRARPPCGSPFGGPVGGAPAV